MQSDQQDAASVGTSETGLEKVDQRYLQLAKGNGFNLHRFLA